MFCPLALQRMKNKKGFRMELGLKNKSVIVTAASGGLGFSIAKCFAAEGANVTVSGRNQIGWRKPFRYWRVVVPGPSRALSVT